MAFIDKKDPVVLNIKITSKGRELLSEGKLNFKYFAIGDSEIDYNFMEKIKLNSNVSGFTAFDSLILRPFDKNPNIISFIPRNLSGDPYNEMTSIPISYYVVHNTVNSIGFFNNDGTKFLTDSNHIKQPDIMIKVSDVVGGTQLKLMKSPTYGTSVQQPEEGDLLLIKWTYKNSTTGNSVNSSYPTPYLIYRIEGIVSGSLYNNNLMVLVDRELPNFSTLPVSPNAYAGAMILYNQLTYSGDSILNMSPVDYIDESVISFLQNSQCPTIVFPFWNLSIIHTQEIAGVQNYHLKHVDFKNKLMGGFVSYIQNQAPKYKTLGVIHYTNSSPANVYAEGFLLNTPKIKIPTIMWHKSNTRKLGIELVASGSTKILTGETKSLNITYYDLCDNSGFVVGKVFPDLKIFIIEDQELLYALSYKSNRSWTLPDFNVSI